MSFISQDSQNTSENQAIRHKNWRPFHAVNGARGGLSEKTDGSMSFGKGLEHKVAENRRNFFDKNRLSVKNGVGASLIHGTNVVQVTQKNAGCGMLDAASRIDSTDALITADKNLILTTTHADCAPVYYFDPKKNTIALAHAGWRGILAGLPAKVIVELQKNFHSLPEDIIIEVGPMISQKYYPVSDELAEKFIEKFGSEVVADNCGIKHLNLFLALQSDFKKMGIPEKNLPTLPPCTYTNAAYSSFRRDGENFAPMMAWLTLN